MSNTTNTTKANTTKTEVKAMSNTKNALTTAITETKNAIITAENGDKSITTNGITTTLSASGNGITTSAVTKDFLMAIAEPYTLREDLKNKTIGKHIQNINKYSNGIKTAVLCIGRELALIQSDKSYTEIGFKSFERFYTDYLKMKKSTVYQQINCYLMTCDIFGNVAVDFEKVGDISTNKALRIGMTPEDFQKTIAYADKNGIKVTADNLTETADKAGASYDKEKAEKDKPAKSKKVTVLPELKPGYFRFITNNKEYIDIDKTAFVEFTKAECNKAIETILNDGLNAKTDNDKMYKVNTIRLNSQYIILAVTSKGIVKTFTLIKNTNTNKK